MPSKSTDIAPNVRGRRSDSLKSFGRKPSSSPARRPVAGRGLAALASLAALALVACKDAPADPRPLLAAAIPPQQYFLERVAGSEFAVIAMTPPGVDPHTYEPRADRLRELSRARAYFKSGLEFENAWLARFLSANPDLKVYDPSSALMEAEPPRQHSDAVHEHTAHKPGAHDDEPHADEHGHTHAGRNPHIWLSPRLVKLQARAMEAALAGLYPEKSAAFAANRARFDEELDALDAHIRQQTSGLSRRAILAYHPSWDYFARDYGLTALSIESEGREPGPAEMAALMRKARALQVRVVFTEPELSARAANIVARELDAEVESVSPLAYEWEANLRRFTELLVRYGR